MSTFNGIVNEFPRIRIDFFRLDASQPPPLACFLSHIHSDHLQGLESLKSPFVYCSAVTRQLLLRVEKYPHRMNFLRGVLEKRRKHYRHLKFVLKVIPLQCPTEIELGPREKIRVSLFDANHCPGAVMFLIQGDGKAVLYTGDVRSEPWWVNSLVRNPILLPYATGLKRLDRMYLDTTFALNEDLYRDFPSKAEGIRELLERLTKYPSETLFYLSAWTFGYEEVWIAMSSFLNARVHIDTYQSNLYGSLSHTDYRDGTSSDHHALNGFQVGNHYHPGCLTTQSSARIHSCEPGTPCHTALLASKRVVWITPIIKQATDGPVIREAGAGGGGGDLYQAPELDLLNVESLSQLEVARTQLANHSAHSTAFVSMFQSVLKSKDAKMSLQGLDLNLDKEVPLREFLSCLSASDHSDPLTRHSHGAHWPYSDADPKRETVHFPFSRHSSYGELCSLIGSFKPTDIYPCTVDGSQWTEDISIRALFGHLCSGAVFAHDEVMRTRLYQRSQREPLSRKRRRENNMGPSQATCPLESPTSVNSTFTGVEVQLPGPDLTSNSTHIQDMAIVGAGEANPDQPYPGSDHLTAIKMAYENRRGHASDSPSTSSTHNDTAAAARHHGQDQTCKSVQPSSFCPESETSPPLLDSIPESPPGGCRDSRLQPKDASGDQLTTTSQRKTASVADRPLNYPSRRDIRLEAYKAARRALETSDSGDWDDLGIRSVGNNGHSQPEDEL